MKIGSSSDGFSTQSISSSYQQINKSMASLSSGKRVNSASDDAASLAISQQMQAQINGTDKAIDNAQSGISLAQTADSGMNSTQDSLQRMRELAVQASNDTLGNDDRAAINDEFSQLKQQISQTAQNTTFNGQKLLDGSLNANIGTAADGSGVNIHISDMSSSGLNLDSLSINSSDSASDAIDKLDSAIDSVSSERANVGSVSNALTDTVSDLMNSGNNTQASQSQITDADMAKASMDLTKNMILQQANIAMLAQQKQNAGTVLQLLR